MTKIVVVGLGLIGGSFAKALKGFPDSQIYGADINKEVLKHAEEDGVISRGYENINDIIGEADVLILCITPDSAIDIINNAPIKKGALVTDVCGVKQYIYDRITNKNVDYIGGHPMAGKECDGYENSDENLFKDANYIIVTDENNQKKHIDMLSDIIMYIGCKKITVTNAENHDVMIAYTSQLMHVVAAALCDNECLDAAEAYSAGSLRDCTRVAKLNPDMWTELFIENREALSEQIDIFTASLKKIEQLIKMSDKEGIRSYLKNTSDRKKRYLAEKEAAENNRNTDKD